MSVQLEHWYQWKDRCSVSACDPDLRMELTGMLQNMNRNLSSYALVRELVDPRNAVSLFDSYNIRLNRATLRPHKEWMMEPVAEETSDLDLKLGLCTRRANGVMKNALVHFLRQEGNLKKTRKALRSRSLDQTFASSSGGEVSMMDSLIQKSMIYLGKRPDEVSVMGAQPADAAAEADFQKHGASLASEMWGGFSSKRREMVLVMALNLPLSNESVLESLNVAQSTLYDRRKSLLEDLGNKIKERFPEEDQDQHFYLGMITNQALKEIALRQNPRPEWAEKLMQSKQGMITEEAQ